MVNDRVARVAGGEENFQRRPAPLRLIGKLFPIHAIRQSHVREQQTDAWLAVEQAQGGCGLGCLDHAKSVLAQRAGDERSHIFVVFDEQDRFCA
jgi:hypothetical protein